MRTRTRICLRAVAVGVLLAAISGCTAAMSPVQVEAAQTAARVKTALVNDPVIGTRVINVRVTGGVVQLTGRVRTQEEAARAVEVARSASGSLPVDSRLQIGTDPATEVVPTPDDIDPRRGPDYEFAELEDTRGAFAVGAALNWSNQRGRSEGARVSISPLLKLGAGAGFGPAVAFDWFDATLELSPDVRVDAGRVRLRPIMAGLRYTLPVSRLSIAPSLVAGYAFNNIRVPEEGAAERLAVGIDNSFVWRPGVSFWIDTSRRTTMHLSIGRVMTKPRVTFIEGGQLRERAISADTTLVSIGLAYKLF